ncbi:MAG: TetR/AcrR family transcriptional regulator [Acidobacteria bacterium]|nr:TetR/AcrR family transcriptional regulator [Acidobacteriota bacterium]
MARRVDPQLHAMRRNQILDAALALIDERGFEHMTMQDVVVEAATSIGNLYHYFPNKDALLEAVVQRLMESVKCQADQVTRELEPGWVHLSCSIYVLVEAMLAHRELARLILAGGPYAALRERTLGIYRAGLRTFFNNNTQLLDTDWLAVAMLGSFALLLEAVIDGSLNGDGFRVWRFLMQWSLRAMRIVDCEPILSASEHHLNSL